jgi:hypothetical protein
LPFLAPSFPNGGRSDLRPLDATSQAFVRRAVLDLGRLQAGLQQDQVNAPKLGNAFACSQALVKAVAAPIAGLGSPRLVQQLSALDNEDRGGPGTWNPTFLVTGDGFIVASSPSR